jgi:hypothetical protein
VSAEDDDPDQQDQRRSAQSADEVSAEPSEDQVTSASPVVAVATANMSDTGSWKAT